MDDGGTGAGEGTGRRPRGRRLGAAVAAAVTVTALAAGGAALVGCFTRKNGGDRGTDAVRTYDRHHTRITVRPGERFALKLPENASTGYAWTLGKPEPDARVVERTGKRRKAKDRERLGAGATLYLDYRAVRRGESRIRLRYCFLCATPHGDPHRPEHKPVELTYHVSVRK